MDAGEDVGLGVRLVLAATVSALVVAALTIVIGRTLITEQTTSQETRAAPMVLVSR